MGAFEMVVLIVALSILGKLGMRWLDERGSRSPVAPASPPEEIEALRQELQQLADQVDRLSEEQSFLTRLLEQRPGEPKRIQTGEGVHDQS